MITKEDFLNNKQNTLKEKYGRGLISYQFFEGELVLVDRSKDFCQLLITRDGSGSACRFNKWDISQLIKILKKLEKRIK